MKTKKEMKQEYRQHKPVMGVFQIKNTANNKCLIDCSTNVMSKWNRHRTELKFGSHRITLLQKEWNEFGAENFEFELLSALEYKDEEMINYTKELKILKEMIIEEKGTITKFY